MDVIIYVCVCVDTLTLQWCCLLLNVYVFENLNVHVSNFCGDALNKFLKSHRFVEFVCLFLLN